MSSSIRILSSSDVDKVLASLSPDLALSSQSNVFKHFSNPLPSLSNEGTCDPIQTPHRITISSESSTMLFMPSRAPTGGDTRTTSIKIVSVPTMSDGGLPATTMVMDESTGRVRAVVNARKLTALRNACGSALFLRLFPNPTPPTHLILFGSGAQSHSHAILFLRLYPSLNNITFIIRSSTARSQSVLSDLSAQFPDVNITSSIHRTNDSEGLDEVVGKGDIIVTATSSTTPLFNSTKTTPKTGARVILIGSYKPTMHEIDRELVQGAGVVVDSVEACMREAGELIDSDLGRDDLVELGSCLDEEKGEEYKRRVEERTERGNGVIVFKSVSLRLRLR
uniref:Ornithine cyclodeaminase n=1 Tax=Kwoniella bestiolae CBS 10118 TaxID=1296100 RepID=A0A1B9G989_9TREE|nr:hypothetical protein I302_02416 [Kwoniella bestiolae CBS 10118]OCF27573.1 hypothetical protein I302_02416 [Kwoniella bestiolae CBS 10118]